jgi:hypothetical protein
MPGDFDASISSSKCLDRLKTVKAGDIICLHDNEKSWKHLSNSLTPWLELISKKKFNYSILPH